MGRKSGTLEGKKHNIVDSLYQENMEKYIKYLS